MEITPTQTGKRRVYNCARMKVRGGEARRAESVTVQRAEHYSCAKDFKNGADSVNINMETRTG